MIRYLSVCSGIEAASCAWHSLGWQPVAFSEIEPFPSAVLAHRFPNVPNWGDMTKFQEWPDATVDLLVGGTPCQSFSVAGLRKGLADPRGNLALVYLAIAARYRPAWVVWENVPGVLSDAGNAFGNFLAGLSELGYGWSYRVLDAQYVRVESHPRAVPQRRRRVFVVGHLGDWRRAAAVLFERESLCGHPAPRRETGEGIASTIRTRSPGSGGQGNDFEQVVANTIPSHPGLCAPDFTNYVTWPASVASTLNAQFGDKQGLEDQHALHGAPLFVPVYMSSGQANAEVAQGHAPTLNCLHEAPIVSQPIPFDTTQVTSAANRSVPRAGDPSHPLAAHAHAPAIAFSCKDHGADAGEGSPTLRSMEFEGSHANGGGQVAVAFNLRGRDGGAMPEESEVASVRAASGGSSRSYIAFHNRQDPDVSGDVTHPIGRKDNGMGVGIGVDCFNGAVTGEVAATMGTPGLSVNASGPTLMQSMQVRRLTPRECERLQGFPDDYTLIQVRGKPAADGPRYRALGNSMAVNVMCWIGWRIAGAIQRREAA